MTTITRLFAGPALWCALCASAGPLNDPTRPPAGLLVAAPPVHGSAVLSSGRRATLAGPAPAVAEAAEPPPLPVVQSIHLPQNSPPSALVDGRLVQLGDKLNGAAVTAIDAKGLLLRSPAGTQRLWLLDAIMRPGAVGETRLAQDSKPPARLAATASASTASAQVATGATHAATTATAATSTAAPIAMQAPATVTLAGKKP